MSTSTHEPLVVLHAPERGPSRGWFATCNRGDCNGGWWPTQELAQEVAEDLVLEHVVKGLD